MDNERKLEAALKRLWQQDAPVRHGDGATLCAALEARYRIRLPDQFRVYLSRWAPAFEWTHESCIALWSPDRVKSMADQLGREGQGTNLTIESEADHYLVFADFLDWCGYGYAICCAEGKNRGKVAMVGSSGDHIIADDLCAFLELTAEDSMVLHTPANAGRAVRASWLDRLKSIVGR